MELSSKREIVKGTPERHISLSWALLKTDPM